MEMPEEEILAVQNSLGWHLSVCSQESKPLLWTPDSAIRLMLQFWMYQIWNVQTTFPDFSPETCLSLVVFPISANNIIVQSIVDIRNCELIPESPLVLTFHIHSITESLLILSPEFISTLPSSSYLRCSFFFFFCWTVSPLAWIMTTAYSLVSRSPLPFLPVSKWSCHTPSINVSVAPLYTSKGKVLPPWLCL